MGDGTLISVETGSIPFAHLPICKWFQKKSCCPYLGCSVEEDTDGTQREGISHMYNLPPVFSVQKSRKKVGDGTAALPLPWPSPLHSAYVHPNRGVSTWGRRGKTVVGGGTPLSSTQKSEIYRWLVSGIYVYTHTHTICLWNCIAVLKNP